jgi:hypothetical protein
VAKRGGAGLKLSVVQRPELEGARKSKIFEKSNEQSSKSLSSAQLADKNKPHFEHLKELCPAKMGLRRHLTLLGGERVSSIGNPSVKTRALPVQESSVVAQGLHSRKIQPSAKG